MLANMWGRLNIKTNLEELWRSAVLKLTLAVIALLVSAMIASAIEFCSGPVRVTCVVDGDTVWIDGEKIRLMDIDAPEMEGGCTSERIQSAKASARLAELLGAGGYEIARQGKDRYGRTLAVISIAGHSVGEVLVAEGLARPWAGHREEWCAGGT